MIDISYQEHTVSKEKLKPSQKMSRVTKVGVLIEALYAQNRSIAYIYVTNRNTNNKHKIP